MASGAARSPSQPLTQPVSSFLQAPKIPPSVRAQKGKEELEAVLCPGGQTVLVAPNRVKLQIIGISKAGKDRKAEYPVCFSGLYFLAGAIHFLSNLWTLGILDCKFPVANLTIFIPFTVTGIWGT